MSVLSCQGLSCRRELWHSSGPAEFRNITADFAPGEFCGVAGPQGCGKGLLLNVLSLLEPADAGEIRVGSQSTAGLPEPETRQLRNETFGFLFDHPCLLPAFSVAENVATPLFRIRGGDAGDALKRTWDALDFCGIPHQEGVLAAHLNPSERQVVAMARALVHRPKILVAVSPRDSSALLPLAQRAAEELGLCVIWAGEENTLSGFAHRILHVKNGEIVNAQRG